MPRRVAIVPHTHWDREWYVPFPVFRHSLVRVLDELLLLMEHDRSYARFLLDGQTAVLDDYLEIRPERADAVRALVAAGRLQIGPWMVLMDEFMVSGETIVRDLQRGIARAAEFGGAMSVGYLPDMFGHVAQMPQILRLAGIEHAVVWRGVPAAIDATAFWWTAPDGSRVRAEYLYGSYSNGRDLPDDPDRLVARARSYEFELGDALPRDAALLLMNGSDHLSPQPFLGRVVEAANAAHADYEFVVTSLPEYLAGQPSDGLPVWCGELRSGARANVLMGVASNRVDVHRAAAAAERALERRAEPLAALFGTPDTYPTRFLDHAWRDVILNSAHDSSCACSHDHVVDAVLVRYRDATAVGDALADAALTRFAADVVGETGRTIVVANPGATTRGGIVELEIPGVGPLHFVADDGTVCPTQLVGTRGGEGFSQVVVGRKIRWIVDLMHGDEFAGQPVARIERGTGPDGRHLVDLHSAGPGDLTVDLSDLRDDLLHLGNEGATIAVRQHLARARRVLVAVPPVAGFGWRTLHPVEPPVEPAIAPALEPPAREIGAATLENAHLRVTVDPTDATLTLETPDGLRLTGVNRLVDGGDGGDTYNYSPPDDDLLVDRPELVRVATIDDGPVRQRVRVDAVYCWPHHVVGTERRGVRRSFDTVLVEVCAVLELRRDEPFLRVRVDFDNTARDHRLRAHFPLPAPVRHSDAECAFAVVRRGLTAEGGPHEAGLPTFVSRRFVDCSDHAVGLALLHDGLLEYEVVEGGRALALTLLRATGYLSRRDLALRPEPAGPALAVEGPQLAGRHTVDYAVLLHRGPWADAGLHDRADEFLVPLATARGGRPDGPVPASGAHLTVTGACVSAVTRDADVLVVRLFNPRPDTVDVEVTRTDRPGRGWIVDLLGVPIESFSGTLTLGPAEIATLRLT